MIHIYYGDGKGKTTAAAGLAQRALGRKLSVLVFKFLKNRGESGEDLSLAKFKNALTVFAEYPVPLCLSRGSSGEREKVRTAQIRLFKRIAVFLKKKPGIVILDEVLDLIRLKWIRTRDLTGLFAKVPAGTELILTGHYIDAELVRSADLVTEMKKVKHYYDKKIAAREGIEF